MAKYDPMGKQNCMDHTENILGQPLRQVLKTKLETNVLTFSLLQEGIYNILTVYYNMELGYHCRGERSKSHLD